MSAGAFGTCGVIPLTSCGPAGTPTGDVVGSELCIGPGAIFPSAVGGTGAADGGGEIAACGGAMVCGPVKLGIAGTRGNENRSLTGGSTGAAAGDVPFSPSTKYGVAAGSTGVLPGD